MAFKIGCSFSPLASFLHFKHRRNAKFVNQQSGAQLTILGKEKSYQFVHGMPKLLGRFQKKQKTALHNHDSNPEDISRAGISSFHSSASDGKPGIISFYNTPYRRNREVILSNLERTPKHSVLWFMCMATLVVFYIFPSLYLHRPLWFIFEQSLVTEGLEMTNGQLDGNGRKHIDTLQYIERRTKEEFLLLFFTEALFYFAVAGFLHLLDRLQQDTAANKRYNLSPQLGERIYSVATLLLSLAIPMVTMGLVWTWNGPAASATLGPYMVGMVVQFTFEQYARYWKSPSRVAIPLIFQVFRLFQLNRAAQLVTALLVTARGAQMTKHNLALNRSLDTISNVLQFLVLICILSISSFLMRFLPSASGTMH